MSSRLAWNAPWDPVSEAKLNAKRERRKIIGKEGEGEIRETEERKGERRKELKEREGEERRTGKR